jgi:hypothetical protein
MSPSRPLPEGPVGRLLIIALSRFQVEPTTFLALSQFEIRKPDREPDHIEPVIINPPPGVRGAARRLGIVAVQIIVRGVIVWPQVITLKYSSSLYVCQGAPLLFNRFSHYE